MRIWFHCNTVGLELWKPTSHGLVNEPFRALCKMVLIHWHDMLRIISPTAFVRYVNNVLGAWRDLPLPLSTKYFNKCIFQQDAINLFLGNYVIQDGEGKLIPCPLQVQKGWKQATVTILKIWRWQLQGVEVILIKSWFFFQFPSVLVFAIAMFCASVILPQEYNTENLLFMLFWGSMIGITLKGILRFGSEFVDFPKLLPTVNQNNA